MMDPLKRQGFIEDEDKHVNDLPRWDFLFCPKYNDLKEPLLNHEGLGLLQYQFYPQESANAAFTLESTHSFTHLSVKRVGQTW